MTQQQIDNLGKDFRHMPLTEDERIMIQQIYEIRVIDPTRWGFIKSMVEVSHNEMLQQMAAGGS